MDRMNELWRDVGGPGTAPGVSVRAVKARVNAALDADPGERKVYMKQKLRLALAAAAAVAALTGSALAASEHWDMLSAFFNGDTSPAQGYVNHTTYSVSDKNYTFTVESSVSDESVLYVVATVKALNEESKTALFDPWFQQMGTFEFYIPAWDQHREDLKKQGEKTSRITAYGGFGGGPMELESEDTRKFRLTANLFGEPDCVELWLGQMGREHSMTIPITPAPTYTLELGATGEAVSFGQALPGTLTIRKLYLSPFTLRLEITEHSGGDLRPNLLFRMADGSVRTQSQLMEFRASWITREVADEKDRDYVQMYHFYEIQPLEDIASVIVFDMEYPLDGSAPFPVEHDPALDPFTVRKMEPLTDGSGYPIPVRELTERLGGVCHWEPSTGDVTCTYRDVSIILHPGVDTATVNGTPVTMWGAPAVQDGSLAASWGVFRDAWSLDGFVTYTLGEEVPIPGEDGATEILTHYHDWYIIP